MLGKSMSSFSWMPLNARILMLVPYEPEEDCRIKWVTQICAQIGKTDVISSVYSTNKQVKEYDGIVYLERTLIDASSSVLAKTIGKISLFILSRLELTHQYIQQRAKFLELKNVNESWKSLKTINQGLEQFNLLLSLIKLFINKAAYSITKTINNQLGNFLYFWALLGSYSPVISTLHRRGKAVSVIPKLIICHDTYALLPAVLLKRIYRCPVIYDSHEFWPEANLFAQKWQVNLAAFIEGNLIRHADVVITVSPQLARHLENQYGIKEVLSVPNAEPFTSSIAPSCDRPLSSPLQFLLQGRVAPRQGIEELLEAWSQLEDERAILNLRCSQNDYLTYLCAKFSKPLEAGRIIILPPVAEEELVSAASAADVGIIHTLGSNLNHVYACPHMLSQYMQSGLAILSHNLEFVSEVINRYKCGLIYDTANLGSFVNAVQFLINHPENLQDMKRNAYESAKSEFNWQVQSASYKNSIEHLYTR